MSYWTSGPGADFSVFQNTSLRRDTSNTSAWRVTAQNGVQPSASTRSTGASRRISAAVACHCSMSAKASGVMKMSPRGSVVTVASVSVTEFLRRSGGDRVLRPSRRPEV